MIYDAAVISARVSRTRGVLEDAVGACVDLDDVGTRGEHGDDAVSLFCYISGIIHNLEKLKEIIKAEKPKNNMGIGSWCNV